MNERPYVILSSAVSLDGYLDTAEPPRLVLSNDADLDRVDGVRADSDAILVGARTVRLDNPRLLVRSAERRDRREASGLPCSPAKVTVTATGDLDPRSAFFTAGDAERIVYSPSAEVGRIRRSVGHAATVVGLGREVVMAELVDDLADRGIRRLMVEGGGTVHTQFLAADLADEVQLAVAPLFVADRNAPRFAGDPAFPPTGLRRAALVESRRIGDMVFLRYAVSTRHPGDRRPAGGVRRDAALVSELA